MESDDEHGDENADTELDPVRKTFKQFDQDGDGTISSGELRSVLMKLDPGYWDDVNLKALLNHIDVNGDGIIQYEEFVAWMTGTKCVFRDETAAKEQAKPVKETGKTAQPGRTTEKEARKKPQATKASSQSPKPKEKLKVDEENDQDEEDDDDDDEAADEEEEGEDEDEDAEEEEDDENEEEGDDADEEDPEEDDDSYDEDDLAQQKAAATKARNVVFTKLFSVKEGSASSALKGMKNLPVPEGAEPADVRHAKLYLHNFSNDFMADAPPDSDRDAALRWLKAALNAISNGDKRYRLAAKWLIGNTRLWTDMEDPEEEGFASLQSFAVEKLDAIGAKYEEEVFEARGLGESLGTIGSEVEPCRPRQDLEGLPLPPGFGGEPDSEEADIAYIALLMTAVHAVDPIFQETARKVCVAAQGACTSPAPKGFMRMMAKMETDHAEAACPRPAENIDTNRIAWTFAEEWQLIEAYEGAKSFGTPRRVKNSYSPSFDALAISKGYRNILVNYHFEPDGLTWGKLASDERSIDAWKALRENSLEMFLRLGYADEASIGVDADDDAEGVKYKHFLSSLDASRKLLSSPEYSSKQVSLVVEVQYMLQPYMDMRKFTHAWYKVVRADNAAALITDYAA